MSDGAPDRGIAELPLDAIVRDGTALHAVWFDRAERVIHANGAFTRLVGRPVEGTPLTDLASPASCAALRAACIERTHGPFLLQLLAETARRATLRAWVTPTVDGFALAAEPPVDTFAELEMQLTAANAELATLVREHVRLAQQLERTHRELRDTHWHIRKTTDVLPYCMTCRSVSSDGHSWEDLSRFISRTAGFLSHGYCVRCGELAIAEADREVEVEG